MKKFDLLYIITVVLSVAAFYTSMALIMFDYIRTALVISIINLFILIPMQIVFERGS